MMAASDQLHVTVLGQGGHGSAPHVARDPVPVLAEVVLALQGRVTRQFDIFETVVVTVGLLEAGSEANTIPSVGWVRATVRTISESSRERMMRSSVRLLSAIAEGHGMDAEVNYGPVYPAAVKDKQEFGFTVATIDEVFGESGRAFMAHPLPAAENSLVSLERAGYFCRSWRYAWWYKPAGGAFQSFPDAQYDDAVLPDGARLYAEWALRRLSALRPCLT
jgi:hippurate hydrolase